MQGARSQDRYTAPAGGRILDGFAQVNAWRGGSTDPLPAKSWIDAVATPEAVVFRVGQVQMAHAALAGGWVKRTGFGCQKVTVAVTSAITFPLVIIGAPMTVL